MNTDLSFDIKEYTSETYGIKMRGHIDPDMTYYSMLYSLPNSAVFIRSSHKSEHIYEFPKPHPDCTAPHDMRPKLFTVASVRVFPNVDKAHRNAVQSLGEKLRVVRVPVLKEDDDYLRGLA